jgi:hypothetical protein
MSDIRIGGGGNSGAPGSIAFKFLLREPILPGDFPSCDLSDRNARGACKQATKSRW